MKMLKAVLLLVFVGITSCKTNEIDGFLSMGSSQCSTADRVKKITFREVSGSANCGINTGANCLSYSNTFELAKFDTQLGTLQSVTVDIVNKTSWVTYFESRESSPIDVERNIEATMNAIVQSNVIASATSNDSRSATLDVFDNVIDYAGTSGLRWQSDLTSTASALISLNSELDTFKGTDTLPFTIEIRNNNTGNGPGYGYTSVNSMAYPEITVSYTYTPSLSQSCVCTESHKISNNSMYYFTPKVVPVAKFDDTTKTVLSITMSGVFTPKTTTYFENKSASPATLNGNTSMSFAINNADDTVTYYSPANVLDTFTRAVAVYDGIQNYAGASGFTLINTLSPMSFSQQITDPAEVSAYVGVGTTNLKFSGGLTNNSTHDSSNAVFFISSVNQGIVSLDYLYAVPDCQP